MDKNFHYIPAQPGWSVVEPIINEKGEYYELHHEPIIAWMLIEEKGINESEEYMPLVTSEPITSEGTSSKSDVWQRPNGSYFVPYHGSFNSVEEVLGFFKKQGERDRQSRN